MEYFKIKQPRSSLIKFETLFLRYTKDQENFSDYIRRITYPKYLSWEKARFISPPSGFTPEEAWTLGRILRTSQTLATPVKTDKNKHFRYVRLDYIDEYLNQFDMLLAGNLLSTQPRFTPSEQNMFLARGILEEAIASSQLEGAVTTRSAAKKMIAENRNPSNESEWMIINNYRAMRQITEIYKEVPLSSELLFDLHRILTENTMEETKIARLRTDKDNIVVGDDYVTTYTPPKEATMKSQLERLIDYANNDQGFTHPIIKAIILHFWVGYLHPFCDGNGRIARSIFYWYLLRKGYWLATFIPISTTIKKSHTQYSDAYIYTEQDNDDFTYFLDYHLRKMRSSVNDFIAYVDKQRAENESIDKQLMTKAILNERQKQAVHYLKANQHHFITITSHSNLNSISLNTARKDIEELEKLQIIYGIKQGRHVKYFFRVL